MLDNIKGCIFDLDGTLADTLDDIGGAVNTVLSEYGRKKRTRAEFMNYVGNGQRFLLEEAFGEPIPDERYADILPKYLAAYNESLIAHTKPYKGISELLYELSAAGIKVSVLSNKREKQVREIIETLFDRSLFTGIHGYTENLPLKPAPDAALLAAAEMEISPSRVVFIGDSYQDVLTGANSGMYTVSVLWGYQSRDKITENSNPDCFCETVAELKGLLLG